MIISKTVTEKASGLVPHLHLSDFIGGYGILIGALLLSVHFRLELPYGNRLGAEYTALPLLFYPVGGLVLAIALGLQSWLFGEQSGARHAWIFFFTELAAALVTVLLLKVLDWQFSGLQIAYFGVAIVGLAIFNVLLPVVLRPKHVHRSFWGQMRLLWKNRVLLKIWTLYNIQSRYSQTILGIAWIVLLPLTTSVVLAFVFSTLLKVAPANDVPYVVLLLSGLVPWNLFNNCVFNSTRAIVGSMGVIGQVYFPREILVFVILGESLVDFGVTFVAMLVLNACFGVFPNAMVICLPCIMAIMVILTSGVMLVISNLSVLIRDIPQLMAIVMQILFYLTPILYRQYPKELAVLNLVNPLAPIIAAFRDVIVSGRFPDLVSLYYPAVVGISLLYLGYVAFKANEGWFADYL
jgi:lipopolysaccharide transport system permease protein